MVAYKLCQDEDISSKINETHNPDLEERVLTEKLELVGEEQPTCLMNVSNLGKMDEMEVQEENEEGGKETIEMTNKSEKIRGSKATTGPSESAILSRVIPELISTSRPSVIPGSTILSERTGTPMAATKNTK